MIGLATDQDTFHLSCFRHVRQGELPRELRETTRARIHPVRIMPVQLYRPLFKYLIAPPIDWLAGVEADVYLFPEFVRWPLARTSRSMVVIYDLAFERAPQHVPVPLRILLRRHVPKALRRADAIVTISNFTRDEIVSRYDVDAAKIVLAPGGVDHDAFYPRTSAECRDVAARHGLPEHYVLFTGTLEPRKNLGGLLAAYSMLPRELKRQHPLALVGAKGWLDAAINRAIQDLRLAGDEVIRTGYVPRSDLPALYSGASAFVFPSLYEGFGLPVLEALACGAPVISADVTSLPEAAGSAAILVDPRQPEAVADALQRVLQDEDLRADLRRRGPAHAQSFRWDASARAVLDAMRRVTQARPSAS
jgi:glycosyltransferase involved in cell wall biosynthesis